MKKYTILALLTIIVIGLISSCSKKSDPVPDSPIVGQWDLNRYTLGDLPTSYSAAAGTFNATPPIDSYTFKNDGTFTYTYPTSTTATSTVNGTWVLSGTVLTVTYTTSSGSSADVLNYSSTASELTTNKYPVTQTVTNPTTNAQETITFSEIDVYKKQ